MGIFVSCAPDDTGIYQSNQTIREYVDQRTLTRVRQVLAESGMGEELITSIHNGRFVTIGGAISTANNTTVSEGDQVIFTTKTPADPDGTIYAQQTVDAVLGENTSKSLRKQIAATIWDEPDVDLLWFSTTPVVELDNPVSEIGSWQTAAESSDIAGLEDLEEGEIIPMSESIIGAAGGPERFLSNLGGWPTANGDASNRSTFILRTGANEYNIDPSTLYHFKENIPGARQLREAAGHAQIVYLEDGEFYATGLLGNPESREEDGTTQYHLDIHGYETFEPVPLSEIEGSLSVSFPKQYGIINTNSNDLTTILRASESRSTGPTYETIGEAYSDITNRLQEHGREEWLSEQPADVVINGWTEALNYVTPGATVPWEAAAKLNQLLDLYEEYKISLEALATEIKSGALKNSSASEALFTTLLRRLQQRSGHEPNLTVEKLRVLREDRYSIEFPSEDSGGQRPVHYIDPPEAPTNAESIERQLRKSKQLIFYGPPGTGKTYTAQRFSKWWVAQQDTVRATTDQVRTVTFHPSYAYEDFVEGLTAKADNDGDVHYEVEKGVFREVCADAIDAYQEAPSPGVAPRYVLIIDEINRGELSQIFGELITLLEADKRIDAPNETTVDLAHSGTPFTVPPNLYIVSTMNTADRSIALVDAAIRRRFRFLPCMPNYELILDTYGFSSKLDTAVESLNPKTDIETALQVLSVVALKQLNNQILRAADMDKGQQIGHTYLLDLHGPQEIADTWQYEILPLIEEHYYGQFDRIREELFAGKGDVLFDWETEQIRDIDPQDLIQELLHFLNKEKAQDLQSRF